MKREGLDFYTRGMGLSLQGQTTCPAISKLKKLDNEGSKQVRSNLKGSFFSEGIFLQKFILGHYSPQKVRFIKFIFKEAL